MVPPEPLQTAGCILQLLKNNSELKFKNNLLPFFHSVKPAVFDLFLTIVIAAYLAAVYLAIFNFAHLYSAICKITNNANAKTKVN